MNRTFLPYDRHDHDTHDSAHDSGRRAHHGGRRGPGGHGRGQGFGSGFGSGFGPGAGFGPGPGFGFGGPGRGGRARRGDVRAAILSLLAENPSNGYGLIKAIAEKTSGAWRPSPGSVYPTLQQLVDEDLIVAVGEGRRSEYTLTEAGRAYIAEHADELASAWEATHGPSESDVAYVESVQKLMGVVHQLRTAGTDQQRAAAAVELDAVRRALYLILAD